MTLYYESHDLGQLLHLTPAAIRLRVQHGSLVPDARTGRGWLFLESTVADAQMRETLSRRHHGWRPARMRQLDLF